MNCPDDLRASSIDSIWRRPWIRNKAPERVGNSHLVALLLEEDENVSMGFYVVQFDRFHILKDCELFKGADYVGRLAINSRKGSRKSWEASPRRSH